MSPAAGPPEAFAVASFALLHYGALAAIVLLAWAPGRLLARRIQFDSPAEQVVVSIGLGLGLLALVVFGLGLAGLLRRSWVLAAIAVLEAASAREWADLARRAASALPRTLRALAHGGWWRLALALVAGLFAAAPLLALPLYPPLGFDATMYHLPFAAAFAAAGELVFVEHLRYPVFPQLQEMLYTLALLFGDDVLAGLLHFFAFLLTAALLFVWGRWAVSTRTGLWAAGLWLINPAALWVARGADVDCALALFAGLAVFAFHKHARGGGWPWLAACGAFAGMAAATKYHGVAVLALLLVGAVALAARRRRWAGPFVLAAAALAVALPLYARIAWLTGNPVFPFFTEVFGHSEWSMHLIAEPAPPGPPPEAASRPLPAQLAAVAWRVLSTAAHTIVSRLPTFLDLPWRIGVEWQSLRGGRLSPLYPLLLPAVLWAGLLSRRGRALLVFAGAYLVFWVSTAMDVRYLFPAVAVLCLLAAEGFDLAVSWVLVRVPWGRRHAPLYRRGSVPRWADLTVTALVAAALLLWPSWGYARGLLRSWGPLPVDAAQRDRFLETQYPAYPALRFVAAASGEDARLYALFGENLVHHFPGTLLGDWFGPYRYTRLLEAAADPERLHSLLVGWKVDYLLVPETPALDARAPGLREALGGAAFRRRLEEAYADGATRVFRVHGGRGG